MKAVSRDGGTLEYATEELRGDREGSDDSSVPELGCPKVRLTGAER